LLLFSIYKSELRLNAVEGVVIIPDKKRVLI